MEHWSLLEETWPQHLPNFEHAENDEVVRKGSRTAGQQKEDESDNAAPYAQDDDNECSETSPDRKQLDGHGQDSGSISHKPIF
jgi:hypothetical protein